MLNVDIVNQFRQASNELVSNRGRQFGFDSVDFHSDRSTVDHAREIPQLGQDEIRCLGEFARFAEKASFRTSKKLIICVP